MIDIKQKREEEYEESTRENIVYLVYSMDEEEGKHYCLPKESEKEAIRDAEELASMRPDMKLYVMKSVALFKAERVIVSRTDTCK